MCLGVLWCSTLCCSVVSSSVAENARSDRGRRLERTVRYITKCVLKLHGGVLTMLHTEGFCAFSETCLLSLLSVCPSFPSPDGARGISTTTLVFSLFSWSMQDDNDHSSTSRLSSCTHGSRLLQVAVQRGCLSSLKLMPCLSRTCSYHKTVCSLVPLE